MMLGDGVSGTKITNTRGDGQGIPRVRMTLCLLILQSDRGLPATTRYLLKVKLMPSVESKLWQSELISAEICQFSRCHIKFAISKL